MRKLFALGVVALVVSAASASILDEPFNYADNAALNAVWNAGSSNPDYHLDTTFGNPEPSYAMPSPAGNYQGRLARNLGGGFDGTDANPLVMSYDFYLADAGEGTFWNGARHYVELRGYEGDAYGSGGLNNLIAMGVNNGSDDAYSELFYQGRVTYGSNWNTLDEEATAVGRAIGWHNMEIMITTSEVRFSVDGFLCEIEARPNGFTFDSVVLGADLTAAGHDAWVDNLLVDIVPEPASLTLLALGGLALIRRR